MPVPQVKLLKGQHYIYIKRYSQEKYGEIPFKNVTPWLSSLKQKETFVSKPCDVWEDAPDTISQLVCLVNSYWQKLPIKYEDRVPKEYEFALFYHIESQKYQDKLAADYCNWYYEHMGRAIDESKQLKTNVPILSINTRLREFKKKLEADPKYNIFTMESWRIMGEWLIGEQGGERRSFLLCFIKRLFQN